MRSPEEVKARAKKVRQAMSAAGFEVGHSTTLEVLARIEGFKDWNTLSAHLEKSASLLPVPIGWLVAGPGRESYEAGCDAAIRYEGVHPAVLRSKPIENGRSADYVTLMQSISASGYVRKRVKLSANLKATDCDGAVTLWFRVDSETAGKMLAFDNLEERSVDGPLSGTTNWELRTIILDVPEDATTLNYGFYLRGTGVGHAASFSLSEADSDTRITSTFPRHPKEPVNLDFSDSSGNPGNSVV